MTVTARDASPARFWMGMAQLFGAGLGFVLLMVSGLSPATLLVTAVVTTIAIAAVIRRKRARSRH